MSTLAAPARTKGTPPDSEQVLLSLVMACPPPKGPETEGKIGLSAHAQAELAHQARRLPAALPANARLLDLAAPWGIEAGRWPTSARLV